MGSFQQVFMGLTCLAAAFFFGRYMHNRPASNDTDSTEVAVVDPIDSLFSMGKSKRSTVNQTDMAASTTPPASVSAPVFGQSGNAIGLVQPKTNMPSQSMFAKTAMDDSSKHQGNVDSTAQSKPDRAIVPDFSDLAARFRHSPLELEEGNTDASNRNPIHASERAPGATELPDMSPPELVIRQPQKMTSLEDFRQQVTRVEKLQADSTPTSERWRVNRDQAIGRFNETKSTLDTSTLSGSSRKRGPQTIDDAFAARSADYLKKPQVERSEDKSDDYSVRRQEITQRAAERNRVTRDMNLFEITDPGNRFANSPATRPESTYSPPQSILETTEVDAVAPPVPISIDQKGPMSRLPSKQLQSIRRNETGGWNRRSNIQTQFRKTYRIVAGDTLQSISTRFYGTPVYYLEIYKANRKALDRINSAPAGIEIVIPSLESIK